LQDKVDRLYHSDCPNTCFSDFLTKSVYHIAQQTDMFVFFLDLCLLFAAWIFRYGCRFRMHPLVNQIPFTRPIKLGLIFKA